MGMSRPALFVLTCALALSAIVPGSAGYIAGRLDLLTRVEADLRAREARLEAAERAANIRQVSANVCTTDRTPEGERPRKITRPTRELPSALAPEHSSARE